MLENGTLKIIQSDNRFATGLGIKLTGQYQCYHRAPVGVIISSMKRETYLEVAYVFDFRANPITGDFGAEIRLGLYCDGRQVIQVTDGLFSGNLVQIKSELLLSMEGSEVLA